METLDLEKTKQLLRAIQALPCNCELLKTQCAACSAKALLNEQTVPDDERAVFSVNLAGYGAEPAMVLNISRSDGMPPLATDTDEKKGVASHEMLLRLAGVLVDALSNVDEFKFACAKWGLNFDVQQG